MGSDFERRSYDESRQYRGVIHQQGRVTLAADLNEAREIADDAGRSALLDVVGDHGVPSGEPGASPLGGPLGVPGPGFALAFAGSPPDLTVGAGALFVGGLRITCGARRYGDQPEWRDQSASDAAWAPGGYLVYLSLCDHEVSAWEDAALREVAIGGPDTATRARVSQRVMRWEAGAHTTCGDAFAAFVAARAAAQNFAPETMRLLSTARLTARYAPVASASECEPAAQQGYLGAENQLVRLQVVAPDTLYWAWDNASTFFKATVIDHATVELQNAPVDAVRSPASDLFVEVLREGVELGAGARGAALTGEPRRIAAYVPDSRRVALAAPLPAEFAVGATVFVRLFHGALSLPTIGFAPVGGTGLEVRCEGAAFVPGDHWMIALRPETPSAVYPARYLDPQPPEGPRRWVAPLGVVRWDGTTGTVLADCRQPFDNLVELTRRANELDARVAHLEDEVQKLWQALDALRMRGGGCCTLTLSPEVLTSSGRSIQEILDEAVGAAAGGAVTICLTSGTYVLSKALALTSAHAGVTIQGCHGPVRLVAAQSAGFELGLVVAKSVPNLTLEGLTFVIPYPVVAGGRRLAGIPIEEFPAEFELENGLQVAVGLRLNAGSGLALRGCTFDFDGGFSASTGSKPPRVVAAGVFATGAVSGVAVHENVFAAATRGAPRTLFGFFDAPAVLTLRKEAVFGLGVRGEMIVPALENASFEGNRFEGLDAAVDVLAQLGPVRVVNNRVSRCFAGFLFKAMEATIYGSLEFDVGPSGPNAVVAYDRAAADDDKMLEARAILSAIEVPDGAASAKWTSERARPREEEAISRAIVRDSARRVTRAGISHATTDGRPGVNVTTDARPGVNVTTDGRPGVNVTTDGRPGVNVTTDGRPGGNVTTDGRPGGNVSTDAHAGIAASAAGFAAFNEELLGLAASAGLSADAIFDAGTIGESLARPAPSFYLAGNDVSLDHQQDRSGSAFSLLDSPIDQSDVVVVGNRMENASRVCPTLLIKLSRYCTITGNVIANALGAARVTDASPSNWRVRSMSGNREYKLAALGARRDAHNVVSPPDASPAATPAAEAGGKAYSLVVEAFDGSFVPDSSSGSAAPMAVTVVGNVLRGEARIPTQWDGFNNQGAPGRPS